MVPRVMAIAFIYKKGGIENWFKEGEEISKDMLAQSFIRAFPLHSETQIKTQLFFGYFILKSCLVSVGSLKWEEPHV